MNDASGAGESLEWHDATPEALREELLEALVEPIGRLIHTSDATRLRSALYRARREAGHQELDTLQIRLLDGERLAITKRQASQATESTTEDL